MFGLSLSFLPFVGGTDGSRNAAPVVLSHDQVEEIGRELDASATGRLRTSAPRTANTSTRSSRRSGDSRSQAAV